MGPDRTHPRVLRGLLEELNKPLSVIYQQCRSTMEVPGHWKLTNLTPNYMKGWKEKPGNHRQYQPDLIVRDGHGVILLSTIM